MINTDENDLKEIRVYYSKTDYCSPKYILNTQNNIFSFENYEDFKAKDLAEAGTHAKKTVLTKLITKPVLYYSELTVQERDFLKNKRNLEKFLEDIDGEIHYHKDCVFLFYKETQIGDVYPNTINSEDTMILVINSLLKDKVKEGKLILNDENDTFVLRKEELSSLIEEYKSENSSWLPKIIKEAETISLTERAISKLKDWLFLKEENGSLIFYPEIRKTWWRIKEKGKNLKKR